MLQAVQLNKFDYRLSNKLSDDLQKLRCRVNYHALKFTVIGTSTHMRGGDSRKMIRGKKIRK